MNGSTSEAYETVRMERIPNTAVQTESVVVSSGSTKHLVYLSRFSQEECTVVRPLNRENIECWSNSKKIDEIYAKRLIVTIEFISGKIILGIEPDVDARMIKIGAKLILESENHQRIIGIIDEIHQFTKDIPYPKKSPNKELSQYTILFLKFVKKSEFEFVKSQFPLAPLFYLHQLQKEIVQNERGELLEGKARYENSLGEIFEGTFYHGKLIEGKITLPNGTTAEGFFNGAGETLHDSGKMIIQGVFYEGFFENGFFVDGTITVPNGDWMQSNSWIVKSFTGNGKLTMPTGEIHEGVFKNGVLSNGRITYLGEGFIEDEFRNKEDNGEGKYSFTGEGVFKDGQLIRGKRTWKNEIIHRTGQLGNGPFGKVYPAQYCSGFGVVMKQSHVNSMYDSIIYDERMRSIWSNLLKRSSISTVPDHLSIEGIPKVIDVPFVDAGEYTEVGDFEVGRFIRGKMIAPTGIWIARPQGEFFKDKELIMTGIIEVQNERFILKSFGYSNAIDSESSQDSWIFSKTEKRLERYHRNRTSTVGKAGSSSKPSNINPLTAISNTKRKSNRISSSLPKQWKIIIGLISTICTMVILSQLENIEERSLWHEKLVQLASGGIFIMLVYLAYKRKHAKNIISPAATGLSSVSLNSFSVSCSNSQEKKLSITDKTRSIEELLIGYLEAAVPLEGIEINEDNAIIILKISKIIDYLIKERGFLKSSIKNSTYSIRQAVLKKVPIGVTTCQVYTNSISPADYNTLEYLVNPLNWVTERVGKQAKIIIDYTILSRSLSERMRKVVVVTRGNTGVGKSHWIVQSLRQHLLPRYLEKCLDEHDEFVHGVLNPDHVKATLKKIDRHTLLNSQVYLEGRIIFERFLEMLTKYPSAVMGTVIDTRLLTLTEFKEALAYAQSRDAKLEIIDVEAPIWCSILSVLNRKPDGKDPCVPFEVIKDGYIRARAHRGEFIHASTCEQVNYTLYQLASNGEYIPIVRKGENDDGPSLLSSSVFEECLRVPSEEEIDGIANTRITEELIQSLDVPRNKDILQQWIGYTVKDALEMHSRGEIPCLIAPV